MFMYRTAGNTGVSPGGLISTHAKRRTANPVFVVFWMLMFWCIQLIWLN